VSNSKGVSLRPGISPQKMHEMWENAIQSATEHPGRTVILRLAPGAYPLPEHGEYEYRAVPTILRVPAPGAEVRFRHSIASGKTTITTARLTSRGEVA
jgi:hypothetical protein